MLEFYNNIDKEKLCDGVTHIVAMDFGEYLTFIECLGSAFKKSHYLQ